MAGFPKKLSLLLAGVTLLFASVGLAREPIAKAYTPWEAGWAAHARSEQARLHAIDRQRQANDLMSWYGTYSPGYYRVPPRSLAYQRSYERRLSRSPVQVPFPGAPGLAYPQGRKVVPALPYLNPSPPPIAQPVGHTKTWTSANGYTYQPVYASDQAPVSEETFAPEPAASYPAAPTPEAIPTPPSFPEAIPTPAPE